LPEQVALTQYHHIRQRDANALLEHWTLRQTAGDVPLKFRRGRNSIPTDEPAPEERDADAGMEPSEDAEEGLQGDDDDQARRGGAPQVNGSRNGPTEPAHPGQSLGNAAENRSEVGWLFMAITGANIMSL
jgi:hypothetical protein